MKALPRLKEQRDRRMLTQEELALLSGVGRDTIAKLETTNRRAHSETVRKLARVLKVRPEDLF
jgi:DNA-binding XRE family transcriptional regulator